MIKMTISDYLVNPAGKGNATIPNRQLIVDNLKQRYLELSRDKKFEVTIYKVKDDYFFHVLVPSEDRELNHKYDVVLQFTSLDENFTHELLIKRYYMKFFSNSPSFVYSYAYVFHKNGILVDVLTKKMRSDVLQNAPGIRNPREIISFEKSLYFACLHLTQSIDFMNKMYLNTHHKGNKLSTLIKEVRNTDEMLMDIRREKQKQARAKKKEKRLDEINSHMTTRKGKVVEKKSTNKITAREKKKPMKKITSKKSTF